MKRKVTAANLRAGQTVYFPDHAHLAHHRAARAAFWRVGSDYAPMPKRFEMGVVVPRAAILEFIERFPGQLTFSRRAAESVAKQMKARAESVEKKIAALVQAHAPVAHTQEGRVRLSHAIADLLEAEGLQ